MRDWVLAPDLEPWRRIGTPIVELAIRTLETPYGGRPPGNRTKTGRRRLTREDFNLFHRFRS